MKKPRTPSIEQDKQGDSKHSPGLLSDHSDAEDKTYKPVSGEENSPYDDAHIILENHLEQEHFVPSVVERILRRLKPLLLLL